KIEIAVIGVHHDEKTLVDIALAAARIELAGGAAQHVTKRQGRLIAPILAGDLDPVRGYPGDVLEPGFRHNLAAEEARPRKYPVLPAHMHEIADEFAQCFVFRANVLPFQPGDFVVQAIGVVVAALRVTKFVTGEQHRYTERQQQRREQVALLLVAQADDRGIVCWSLDPAIPAEIRVVPVAVLFTVGLVVLFVVADEVVQREAVMRGDEVDARPRASAAVPEDVGRADDAGSDLRYQPFVALPAAPNRVAV